MGRRYDILVVDLDGTLLGRDGQVSTKNRDAIATARAEGMMIIVATGRALVESIDAIVAIEHEGLVIAAGGSMLADASTGRTVRKRVMDHAVVAEASIILQQHGHCPLILKDNDAVGYDYLVVGSADLDAASAWWFETFGAEVRYVDHHHEDSHPHETLRAGAVASSGELAPLALHLQEILGDRVFLQHWSAVTESSATGSDTHLLEIFNPKVNKWTMLQEYCQEHGHDHERIVAIGDGLNDVELVANVGLGVAMANANPAVRSAARQHTTSHEDDGVALAVQRVLSGEW